MWLKEVTGFNPAHHCAKCLTGKYIVEYGLRMQANTSFYIPAKEGGVYYACGVASPYKWNRNMHLAMTGKQGSTCKVDLYTGDSIVFDGFEQINFDSNAATSLFSGRAASYLTCRNFQFGCHYFGLRHE